MNESKYIKMFMHLTEAMLLADELSNDQLENNIRDILDILWHD